MKKLKKLTFLIIMLALIITLSACTDGFDDGTGGGSFDQTIVGTGVNRKVVYSVSMTIEVSDVKKVKTALISLAEEKGGFIERNSEDFYSGNVQQGYLTIKVPTDKLDEFMSSVSGTGKTLYKEVYTTDITDDYVDATAKIAALNEQKTAYQQLLQDATITASDRVEIIKEIAAVDTELYRLMELVNEYDSMIDYSTVSIDIELAPGFFEVAVPIVIGVIFLAGIGVAIYCLFRRQKSSDGGNGIKTAIKILMVLSCVAFGIYVIPLCWSIPMTVVAFKKMNKGEKLSLAFKICTLLFVNTIAGILMLCDNENN